jgi:cupin fold WbuC family metalloprotein
MNWRKVNDEVYYLDRPGVPVGEADLDELIRLAADNPRRRARLCTHQGPDSLLQEMFIVHGRSCYVRPHKHLDKEECVTILLGEVDIVLFDDDGNVTEVVRLGARDSGRPFSCRMVLGVYHMFLIRSETLVFCEATTGPFDRDKMVFAPWSPDEDGDVHDFLGRVERAAECV